MIRSVTAELSLQRDNGAWGGGGRRGRRLRLSLSRQVGSKPQPLSYNANSWTAANLFCTPKEGDLCTGV